MDNKNHSGPGVASSGGPTPDKYSPPARPSAQLIDGMIVYRVNDWWIWRDAKSGQQLHAGLDSRCHFSRGDYVLREGLWYRHYHDPLLWEWAKPYTLYRGENQQAEYNGILCWNWQRESLAVNVGAGITDMCFFVNGSEVTLSPKEIDEVEQDAMKMMAWEDSWED